MPSPAPHPVGRICGLATALPRHRLSQDELKAWAARHFSAGPKNMARLIPAFDHAGIETRYSCVPLSWYSANPGWREKNRLYLDHAPGLAADAARRCLGDAGIPARDVDGIVLVSTSGIATPSLDARLIGDLELRPDVTRTPLFGLGCAGGVLGLARAAECATARPGRNILFVVVELCGLTFRSGDLSKSNVIAAALFGDGAAAALISTDGDGPAITGAGEHMWPDTLSVMGWSVEDDGFGVVFSRDIPNIVRNAFGGAARDFLEKQGLALSDLAGFICHPGGAKVVAALEEVLALPAGGLVDTREILREFGNMSAASVMFVMERTLASAGPGTYLTTAVGPGFTAAFVILEVS